MANIVINDPNYEKPITYYMEDRIKKNVDDKIRPALEKKDEDYIIAVDGQEGCQPKGSKVLMADGSWKNVEDIKIGDEILSPQVDNSYVFSKVRRTFKFKSKNIYDVYEKNRDKKLLYSCSSNHWIPLNVRIGKKNKKWIIKNFMAEDLYKKKDFFLTNTTAITPPEISKFKNRENCRIEPYSLGAWLGDGHFSSKKRQRRNPLLSKETLVRGHYRNLKDKVIWQREHKANYKKKEFLQQLQRNVGITCNDIQIIDEISKHYPIMKSYGKLGTDAKTYRFSLRGEFARQLSIYGLEGMGSGEKFIPKDALFSDSEYRKKLLAGLIDTDGYLSNSKAYSITTKSHHLAKDIEFLVYSLGGRARISKIMKKCKEYEGTYFKISFYLGKISIPLKLKRKQRDEKFFYLSANRKSIKLSKRKSDIVYGFELDSNSHFYITDNYVVTRNSGKSTFAFQLGKYIDPTLSTSRVVFSAEDFKEAIFKAKKGQVVIYDEAFTGLSSRNSLSAVNRVLVSLMMQMRQKNLCVILVLPTFFLLDKYAALFRSRVLFHVYKNKGIRGYYLVYNRKLKKLLYLTGKKDYSYKVRTRNKGRFYGVFALGDASCDQKYRKMKGKALEESEKTPMTAGQVKYRDQRDLLLYLFRKNLCFTYEEISLMLGDYDLEMTDIQIGNICRKFGDKGKIKVEEAIKNLENIVEKLKNRLKNAEKTEKAKKRRVENKKLSKNEANQGI